MTPGRRGCRRVQGYWIDDCATVAEVARYVDLAELTVAEN